MYEAHLTDDARDAFRKLYTRGPDCDYDAAVDVLHKIEVIENVGVMNEEMIAEIDSNYVVHLLNPSSASRIIRTALPPVNAVFIWQTVYHSPVTPMIFITHIFRPRTPLGGNDKRQLAQEAAGAIHLTYTTIITH
jgi:hypothetical protein